MKLNGSASHACSQKGGTSIVGFERTASDSELLERVLSINDMRDARAMYNELGEYFGRPAWFERYVEQETDLDCIARECARCYLDASRLMRVIYSVASACDKDELNQQLLESLGFSIIESNNGRLSLVFMYEGGFVPEVYSEMDGVLPDDYSIALGTGLTNRHYSFECRIAEPNCNASLKEAALEIASHLVTLGLREANVQVGSDFGLDIVGYTPASRIWIVFQSKLSSSHIGRCKYCNAFVVADKRKKEFCNKNCQDKDWKRRKYIELRDNGEEPRICATRVSGKQEELESFYQRYLSQRGGVYGKD